jgi:hypothetical protein
VREGREPVPRLLVARALGSAIGAAVGHILAAKAEVGRDLRCDRSGDSARGDGLPASGESHVSGSWRCQASPTRALDDAGSGSWRRGALDAAGSSVEVKAALGAACAAGEARVTVEKRKKTIRVYSTRWWQRM